MQTAKCLSKTFSNEKNFVEAFSEILKKICVVIYFSANTLFLYKEHI